MAEQQEWPERVWLELESDGGMVALRDGDEPAVAAEYISPMKHVAECAEAMSRGILGGASCLSGEESLSLRLTRDQARILEDEASVAVGTATTSTEREVWEQIVTQLHALGVEEGTYPAQGQTQ